VPVPRSTTRVRVEGALAAVAAGTGGVCETTTPVARTKEASIL